MADVNSVLSRCCWWRYIIKAVSSIGATWHFGDSAESNKTANNRTGKCSQHKRHTCVNSYTSHVRSHKAISASSGFCWWWWFWEWSWARRSNWGDTRATKTGRGSCPFRDGHQENKSEFCYAAKNLFVIMLGMMIRLCAGILRSCGLIHGRDDIYHFFKASSQALLSPLMLLTQLALNWNFVCVFKPDHMDKISYVTYVKYWVFVGLFTKMRKRNYSQTSVHELNLFLKVVRKPKLFSQ